MMSFVGFLDSSKKQKRVDQKPYEKVTMSLHEACKKNKVPYNSAATVIRDGVWNLYWEEVRKEEQRLADLGLERTHYMVEE